MKDWLWERFCNGWDAQFWWAGAIATLVGLIILAVYLWNKTTAEEWETRGKVLGKVGVPDTLQTHAVPVIGSNGTVGVGVATTGTSREYITLIEVDGQVYEFENLNVFAKSVVGHEYDVCMRSTKIGGPIISAVYLGGRQ